MNLKILQWNLNGFKTNLLQILIKTENPDIIPLQETHYKNEDIKISNYVSIKSPPSPTATGYLDQEKYSAQGPPLPAPQNTQAAITEKNLNIKIVIILIYIPPSQAIPQAELEMRLNQQIFF